jgi:lipopolysaccharide export system permease protein
VKTLHIYLTRQVVAALLMTVTVFTFVLLLGNVLREILSLLVNQQVGLGTVLEAILLLIPFVLVFALPMGLLTATLLVFGRFSADHELTAVRSGGVSLVSLITPILALSVVLSGVCAWINLQLAPQCRVAYKRLLYETSVHNPAGFLTEKTFITAFTNYIVYLGKLEGNQAHDVLIYSLRGDKVDWYVRARSGKISVDPVSNLLQVVLNDAWRISLEEPRREGATNEAPAAPDGWTEEYAMKPIPLKQRAAESVKISDMTIFQLWAELQRMEKSLGAGRPASPGGAPGSPPRPGSWAPYKDLTAPIRLQIHRQISFSFACIGFTLVGIPLGIRAHRRETSFGIAVALLLVALYFSFFLLGMAFENKPEWAPHLILWLPNFIFQSVGAVLLWRANRGI